MKNVKLRLYQRFEPAIRSLRAVQYHLAHRLRALPGTEGAVHVIFLVQRPEIWNSVRTVFEAMVSDPRFRVTAALLPEKHGEDWTYAAAGMEPYFRGYPAVKLLRLYDGGRWTDIAALTPDYIFLARPYRNEYPAAYALERLADIAPLCYVPYGYSILRDDRMQAIVYDAYLLYHVRYLFAPNENAAAFCRRHLRLLETLGVRKIQTLGYPRFDGATEPPAQRTAGPMTVLWTPRWTTEREAFNKQSGFFDYKDAILRLVAAHPGDFRLLLRPHPQMFSHFEAVGAMTGEEAAVFRARFAPESGAELDRAADYRRGFDAADVLLSDYSSLLIEFFLTGKPVIYCDDEEMISEECRPVFRSFYHARTWPEIEGLLHMLRRGDDPLRADRLRARADFLRGQPKNAGKAIAAFLLSEEERHGKGGTSA